MTDAPPSRYKVVERGRRLVVIDTRTGQPATREPAPGPATVHRPPDTPVESVKLRKIDDRSGAAILRTHHLYDLKGPREIAMTQIFSDRIGRAIGGWLIGFFVFAMVATLYFPPLWLIPAGALLQPRSRAALRSWMTARLDKASQAAS